jgi:hypothetical protein
VSRYQTDLKKPKGGSGGGGGGGGSTDLSYTASTRVIASSTGSDATLPLFTSAEAGLVAGSGGGTANFLRADGTWAAPASGGLDQSQVMARMAFGGF